MMAFVWKSGIDLSDSWDSVMMHSFNLPETGFEVPTLKEESQSETFHQVEIRLQKVTEVRA